jgi:phage terminase small subunit
MSRKKLNENGLTDVEQRYCDEYLIDHNQTAAAIRAGVKTTNAKSWASKKSTKATVRAYIDRREAEISRRLGITAERIKAELARVAFANPVDILNAADATVKGEANRDDTAAINSVKVKSFTAKDGSTTCEREVRLNDKNKALELLGRAEGMLTDNLRAEMTGTVVIEGYNDPAEMQDDQATDS